VQIKLSLTGYLG